MCLSAEALALFLSMLSPEIVEAYDDRVLVHATEGTAEWRIMDGEWCTDAVAKDAALRLK